VLEARQMFELKSTLNAINFDVVVPEIEENRYKVIRQSQRRFLRVLNDIKYLKNAYTNYILYNSPVDDLKPFLSEKVSLHTLDFKEVQKLVKHFVSQRYNELTTFNFEPFEPKFSAKIEDFYNDHITDNGIGEEVENFIRAKMMQKLQLSKKQEVMLMEEIQAKTDEIDALLKRLKVNKIEQMMQNLVKLKTNLAQVKEVVDRCKDIINGSTITNKAGIFLIMDNLYYKLSKKCENLQEKIKLKLQLVDKEKLFGVVEDIENPTSSTVLKRKNGSRSILTTKSARSYSVKDGNIEEKSNIASNLYDDDDPSEIDITEDDGTDDAEDEIVIDDN